MVIRNKSCLAPRFHRSASNACALVLLAGLVAARPAAADCLLPPPPSKIPNGTTASEQEMVAAMQTLQQYNGDVTVYLKCIEFEARQNRLPEGLRVAKHNDAVSQLEQIADKFNEQVRIFKSKHG
ncbi:MAG TPA: hypothetical protein VMD03_01310 [Steroidobacteraceae bacterium]|nr:hypothetical protein [Steroidobacteraceae bacterium]